MLDKVERVGLAVYLYYNRDARKLAQHGDVIYQSKKLRYVLLYVNAEKVEETQKNLEVLKFVKKVSPSQLAEIDQDFVGNLQRFEKNNENKVQNY